MIEMEKQATVRIAVVSLQAELATTKVDFHATQEVVEHSREEVAHDLDHVKVTLAEEHHRREELEKALKEQRLSKMPTPSLSCQSVTVG